MNTEFALLFGAALVLGAAGTLLQHRAYSRAVNRLADTYRGRAAKLVSGRHKGKLRGAIVLLVVDEVTRQVLAAEKMTGMSVLARFRPAPELLGLLRDADQRATNPQTALAVQEAQQQFASLMRQQKKAPAATQGVPQKTAHQISVPQR
ncbi:transcriptional regulator GutM [Kocuria sp. M1R5S2]|uniref:transcriptional regulator GutM n=1 Tax=Kocuria rhizosphaerae TaxID=3376285 RepID=UPI003793EE2D